MFGATVINGVLVRLCRDCDGEWRYGRDVQEKAKYASHADICAAVHHGRMCRLIKGGSRKRQAIDPGITATGVVEAKPPWESYNVLNALGRYTGAVIVICQEW
jgi:hypothetical protein